MNTSHENTVGVFISYNRQDHLLAKTFAQHVHELGMKPWVDFGELVGGDPWKQAIETALRESLVVLVLLTPESVSSEWVRYEINRAIANGRKVIPLMIRTCSLPPELEDVQFIDFRSDTDQRYKELTKALLRTVVRPMSDTTTDTKPELTPEVIAMREAVKSEYPGIGTLFTPQSAKSSAAGRPLALVIEDQEPTQRFLREVLLDMGFEVHIAATRSQVMDHIRKHSYRFITLDMNLDDTAFNNGQDGIMLLGNLKRYQEQVPVVIISNVEWSGAQMRDFLLKHGVKDVLGKKPFIDTEELQTLVLKHVGDLGG